MTPAHTPIRRILVPHDFSETADGALRYALDLAERLEAAVTVVHVYDVPSYGFPEGIALSVQMEQTIATAARTALDNIAVRARRPGVDVEHVLRRGAAWSEIIRLAAETDTDLVVMGTHGRHGVARFLLGSVAEKVVRTAPCPVLTVHGPREEPAAHA